MASNLFVIFIAVKLILKFMSLMNWMMKPRNGVAYGMNAILLSVLARTLFSSSSIDSIAEVLSLNYSCSVKVSTRSSRRNAKRRPFCAQGYRESCLSSFGLSSASLLAICTEEELLDAISRPKAFISLCYC